MDTPHRSYLDLQNFPIFIALYPTFPGLKPLLRAFRRSREVLTGDEVLVAVALKHFPSNSKTMCRRDANGSLPLAGSKS